MSLNNGFNDAIINKYIYHQITIQSKNQVYIGKMISMYEKLSVSKYISPFHSKFK